MDPQTLEMEFAGELYYWRGPSPYHFIRVPEDVCVVLHDLAPVVSYGWGVIPVSVRIGETDFETSLLPKDGGYVVAVKPAGAMRERGLKWPCEVPTAARAPAPHSRKGD